MGAGRFLVSDRYSVFDWGEMPDHLEGKGTALCLMGAYCFEQLEKQGVKTHYRGIVNNLGKTVTLPEGFSIFKRLAHGKVTQNDLGLDHQPQPSETVTNPIFDVSTKLEETDRYITWAKAKEISSITDQELDDIKTVLLKADTTITKVAANACLKNENGEIEIAFNDQHKLMLVDVLGTLDEFRFTFQGLHVSKELAHQFYNKTQWRTDVEHAKKDAEPKDVKNWKTLYNSQPTLLDCKLKTIISQMYMVAANEMTKKHLFDAPKLANSIDNYKGYIGEKA